MSLNVTSQGSQEKDCLRPIHYAVLVMSLLILLTNGMVIYLFVRFKSLRTVSNKILTSLAVVDLVAGLFSPMFMSCDLSIDSQTKLLSCIASTQKSRFLALSCIYHILASTVEKFYAISCPLQHRCSVRSQVAYKVIVFLWVIPLFVATIPLMWIIPEWSTLIDGPHNTSSMQDIITKTAVYDVTCAVIGFVIPFFVLVICFTKMYITIRTEFRRIQDSVRKSHQVSRHSSFVIAQTKPLLVFALLLFIYTVCWFPFFMGTFAISYNLVIFSKDVESLFVALRYVNCFLNPLCYAFLKADFRGSLQSSCKTSHTFHSSMVISVHRDSFVMSKQMHSYVERKGVSKQSFVARYPNTCVMSGQNGSMKLKRRHTIN